MSETEMRSPTPPSPAAGEPSLADLMGSLLADARSLVRKEIELARAELGDELARARQAGIVIGAGAATAAVGALLLVIMLVQVLIAWGLAPWLAYMIIGGALTAVGALALMAGLRRAQTVDPLPRETIETVREDVEWLKEQSPFEKR